MRLVRKTGRQGRVDQFLTLPKTPACKVQPSRQRVPVRTGRERRTKLAGQLVTAEPCHALQFNRSHYGMSAVKEFAGTRKSRQIEPCLTIGEDYGCVSRNQSFCETKNQAVARQRLQSCAECAQDGRRQERTDHHRLANERQLRWFAGEDAHGRPDLGRGDIHDAIAKAAIISGAAVMRFVRVENCDLARQTAVQTAAVVECLDAIVRDADAVSVMPMWLVAAYGEARLEQFDPTNRTTAACPGTRPARSFKTNIAGASETGCHEASLLVNPSQTLAFIGFAAVLAGTPGPSNALLTATGAAAGIVRGLPALVGVGVGMAAMMFVVVLGMGTLILRNPLVMISLKVVGVAILLWFAWKIAMSRPPSVDQARPVGLLGAAAFQWVNPKSWLACTSAAVTYFDASRGTALTQASELAFLFALVALPCCFVWLAFGAAVQRSLRSERAARMFNYAMGSLLAASVLLILLD